MPLEAIYLESQLWDTTTNFKFDEVHLQDIDSLVNSIHNSNQKIIVSVPSTFNIEGSDSND